MHLARIGIVLAVGFATMSCASLVPGRERAIESGEVELNGAPGVEVFSGFAAPPSAAGVPPTRSPRGLAIRHHQRSGAPPPAIDPCRVGAENCLRLRHVDHWLVQLDGLLRTAHFDEVVSQQQRPRILLDALPRSSTTRRRRVRLEILSATAYVALGRREEAEACFGRALAADPNLRLDPGTTSPKVLRVLDYARDTYVAHTAR